MTGDDPERTRFLQSAAQQRRERRMVVILIVAALIVRIILAVLVERHVSAAGRKFLIEGDAGGYWELGQRLAAGEEYSVHQPPRRVMRTPGFPLLVAAGIRAFGPHIFPTRLLLAVVGAGCCWLTYLLGRRLAGHRVGMLAAAFTAFHPLHAGTSVLILSETWFTLWMLAALLFQSVLTGVKSRDILVADGDPASGASPDLQNLCLTAFACGFCSAAAALVRPGFILWLPLAVACCFFRCCRADSRSRMICVAVLCAGAFLVLGPWAWRNHTVTGHWVVTSLWSGPSLYDGLNPEADGTSDMRFFDEENVMSAMSEYEMNRSYSRRAFQFAVDNPLRALQLAIIKAGRFLSPVLHAEEGSNRSLAVISVFCWGVLFACGAVAVWQARKNGGFLLITGGPMLLFLLVHMVFVGSVRYRLPAEFPLAVAAATAIVPRFLESSAGTRSSAE